MSRHILPLPKGGHIVIGYDRPLNHFFIQEWRRKNKSGFPSQEATDIDLDEVTEYYKNKYNLNFPKTLRETMGKEVLGQSDTNACKTWEWDK